MSDEQYLGAGIKAWAKFDGGIRFDDVVSISATFALNSIPTASLVVAVGRAGETPADGRQDATIHKAKPKIKPRMRVEVYAEISNLVGNTSIKAIKPGTYKIFDGYVAGMGYQRSHNHANYVIHLVHWLDDLNNSSAINGNWFPGVPHDYAQQSLYDRIGPNGEVSTGAMVPQVARELANHGNLTSDLWKKVIKPLFARVAGFSGGAVQNQYSGGTIAEQNTQAHEALKKIPGDGPYTPLALKLNNSGGINFDASVSNFFAQTLGSSFVQNTFWSKLINDYAAQFLFAISPAVEWATPIPFCAGLRAGTFSKTITAKEYNYANFNSNMAQVIEAVYVEYPSGSSTNTPIGRGPNLQLSYYRTWGRWPKNPQKGLKLFKNPPAWLANLDAATITALNTASTMQDAVADRANADSLPNKVKDTGTAIQEQESTMENFAKHWYYTEVLQQRYGEFAGPLRFDIAPGNIIKIDTPIAEKTLFNDTNPYVVASVISVSFVINAERATAGTSFTIAHIKTKAEESDDLYATTTPPMYNAAWPGGPLAKGAGDAGFGGFQGDIGGGGVGGIA